jgi:hypothetical protein
MRSALILILQGGQSPNMVLERLVHQDYLRHAAGFILALGFNDESF